MDILLIPGLWLDGDTWAQVLPPIVDAGHRPHVITLPGMESVDADRSGVTLQDHVDAVVGWIDAIGGDAQVVLVGHSGGGAVAHAAVDARPDRVARVVYVDMVPLGDGMCINDSLPVVDGQIPLPDWAEFDDADLVDLDDDLRAMFRARAIPAPVRVACDPKRLSDPRRYDVPATLIACEFTGADVRAGIEDGAPWSQELSEIRDLEIVDLPTGHWPQFTRPQDLGRIIAEAASA